MDEKWEALSDEEMEQAVGGNSWKYLLIQTYSYCDKCGKTSMRPYLEWDDNNQMTGRIKCPYCGDIKSIM